jgi:ATP-binding cassette subfamily F protein 3
MNKIEAIDGYGAEDRAIVILEGLGFNEEMRNRPTKSLSGGWRMRVALARALFV